VDAGRSGFAKAAVSLNNIQLALSICAAHAAKQGIDILFISFSFFSKLAGP
jgi:hypothetical protein